MSFQNLKRSSQSNFDKLKDALNKMNSGQKDDSDKSDYWTLARDKAGNGYAVIRFLPAPDGEDFPYVRIWDHGFQGPGGWYIEKSLTTLGLDDPCGRHNATLWNSGIDADKETARKQKRRLKFHANIYVVKDPANPENEGKVFRFAFGKKIFDKINDLMNPQFEDEDPINPFDFWTGANFKLKIRQVEGYPNYDKSEFDEPAPLLDDDDALEEIYTNLKSLKELIDPSQFKSYEQLEARLNKVLGSNTQKPAPQMKEEAAPKMKEQKASYEAPLSTSDDDEEDDFFKSLMSDEEDPF